MDSLSQRDEHESCAKRLKLDLSEIKNSVMCNGSGFSEFSACKGDSVDHTEGPSPDCDSGYDASTLESVPTLFNMTSPNTDICDNTGDTHESLSEIVDPDMEDDNVSTVSNLSDLSGLSDLSEADWKTVSGSMQWIQKQMQNGIDPRSLLSSLGTDTTKIPEYMDDIALWKVIINMLAEPPRRHKLRHVNTLDDVVRLLKGSKNIIVLTGAGVSVSCGIPDFRSRDGIYSRLAVDFPDLPDPQAMFDISYFGQDPRPFFKFAKDIYPGKFQPSPCHRFIKLLEKYNKLLRNYTQNIDTLEKVAGIERVVECHGSFATATCTRCSYRVDADDIKEDVAEQRIPLCPRCLQERGIVQLNEHSYRDIVSQGIMKPDIVFFGEGLPDHFHESMTLDKMSCDLLIVIGSSLKVRPVALIPSSLAEDVPQILINREPLPHCHFDVELLGDCDVIINQLCHLMGGPWTEGCWLPEPLKETIQLLPPEEAPSSFCHIENTQDILSNAQVSHNTSTNNECQLLNENTSGSKKDNQICNTSDNATTSDFENSLLNDTLSQDSSFVDENNTNSLVNEGNQETCSSEDVKEKYTLKERHISIDSARDSGIGEGSNFTDGYSMGKNESLRNLWEPKVKHSLADRLPKNMYYLVQPSRYIFPGAEVYYDPDEKYGFSDDSSSDSDDSDSESDIENGDKESELEKLNKFIGSTPAE